MRSLPDDDMWAGTACAEAELGISGGLSAWLNGPRSWRSGPGRRSPKRVATVRRSQRPLVSSTMRRLTHSTSWTARSTDARPPRLRPAGIGRQDTTARDRTALRHHGLGTAGHPAHRACTCTPRWRSPPAGAFGPVGPTGVGARPQRRGEACHPHAAPDGREGSQQWLTSVAAVLAARVECPQTRVVSVGDREADVYDLLALARPAGVDLRMRAAWERGVAQPEHDVWATVAAQPVEATSTVQVPRRGAQPPRTAPLAVRWVPDLVPAPASQARRVAAVPRWAVQALEEAPPAGPTRSSGCC